MSQVSFFYHKRHNFYSQLLDYNTYFQWISILAPTLFSTRAFIPFIKLENSFVMQPCFWAVMAFAVDICMICNLGSTPGQQDCSLLATWFSTSFASFSGTRSHLLHTNKAHLLRCLDNHWHSDGNPSSVSKATFLTSASNFSSCKNTYPNLNKLDLKSNSRLNLRQKRLK